MKISQVQVQMGLFGGVRIYAGDPNTPYPAVTIDSQLDLYFSEIDPNLHNAVATGNYGPGKAVTSTMNYDPKYFLINGRPYDVNSPSIEAGLPGDTTLLRFYNAGLESHVASVDGLYMTILSEEGFLYPFKRIQNTALLAAGQTRDALVTLPSEAGYLSVFDRTLHLTNDAAPSGGMMAKLQVGAPAANDAPVISLLEADPSVIYGLGDSWDGDIRRRDLDTDTPYNTYTRHGLPPTPIAMPGKSAIEAAATPAAGSSMFFVASGSGGHVFSDTLDEHNAAVRQMLRKKP